MRTHLKFAWLAIVLLLGSVVPITAQEAMSDSYFQAALEAIEKGNHSEAVRFARLGLLEVERLQVSNPNLAHRQTIRGLNLLSGALIELKSYSEAEKVKREEIELMERLRSRADYPEYSKNYPMSLESLGFILTETKQARPSRGSLSKGASLP